MTDRNLDDPRGPRQLPRAAFLLALAVAACTNTQTLKQPSDAFIVENPSVVAAVALAILSCNERGYDTAQIVSHKGAGTTFRCTGVLQLVE